MSSSTAGGLSTSFTRTTRRSPSSNCYPTVRGYVLVAPKEHRVDVARDFTEDEYVALQRVVHRVGCAVCAAVETERLYLLSLRSHQGNAHVHWQVFPLPPGVPYEEQQLVALDWGPNGEKVLDLGDAEQAALAMTIRREHCDEGRSP